MRAAAPTLCTLLALTGCGTGIFSRETDSLFFLRTTSNTADDATAHFEDGVNHQFELAEKVNLLGAPALIHGEVSGGDDVDIYDLGPVTVGDRIVVTMKAADSLFGALGLFDQTGTTMLINDHRNVYLRRTEPFIDVVVRRDSAACYVAASSTPGFSSSGPYELLALKEPFSKLPPSRPDVVLLVFDGAANVRIGGRPAIDIPPFDAANISSRFTGQTGRMTDEIVARVRDDFAGLDVVVLSTSEADTFAAGMTRIYFGTSDPALLGVAEGVDEFNATYGQQAIVFTDTFAAFMRLSPTLTQTAQAVANVASHEIGHLLGLVHTRDPVGIMDVTASLRELLEDQQFVSSPIYGAVFPVGWQDAPQYLLDVLGGDAEAVFEKETHAPLRKALMDADLGIPPARSQLFLSTCSIEHEH